MRSLLKIVFILGALTASAITACADQQPIATSQWPEISPLTKRYYFPDVDRASISKLIIHSYTGKPLYRISCYPGEPESGNITDFDYSGFFQCRLVPLYGAWYGDLFASNPQVSSDWATRSRFMLSQLLGKCGTAPEYGSVRRFLLRGMRITLSIKNLKPPSKKAQSFAFIIKVENDPEATRAIAAVVPFPPPSTCPKNSYPPRSTSKFYPPIDWESVPFITKPHVWNRSMQIGAVSTNCSVWAGTFRGVLVARRIRAPQGQWLPVIILRLDQPIDLCSSTAPHVATSEVVQALEKIQGKLGTPASAKTKLQAAAGRSIRLAKQSRQPLPAKHITALGVSWWDLSQLNALNREFIGHPIKIEGRLSRNTSIAMPRNLPYTLLVDRICRLGAKPICN